MRNSLVFTNIKRQINWPEKLASVFFLLYAGFILIPGILWRIQNKWYVLVIIVLISIINILFDKDMPKRAFFIAMIRYSCAGILALFYGWINRGANFDWTFYLTKGLLAWYPIVFVSYLIQNRNTRMKVMIKYALLMFITLTCVTTLVSIREFPMASRWLSSGAYDSESAIRLSFSRMNIGNFSFVYMLVLLTPILLGIITLNRDRRIKVFYSSLLILFGVGILFTQFLIAIYMMILCYGILLISHFMKYLLPTNKAQISSFIRMLCALPVVFVLFIVMFKPLNTGLNNLFTSLSLGSLSERIESLSSLDKSENIQNSTNILISDPNSQNSSNTSISDPDSQTTSVLSVDDSDYYSSEALGPDYLILNSSDPLTSRLQVYLRPFKTIQNNLLTGNLFSHDIVTSQHSDVIDTATGGGLLGDIFAICLFTVMFYGLYKDTPNSKLKNYTRLSFLMCLGLATINSIYFSREIILICMIMPIVIDAHTA